MKAEFALNKPDELMATIKITATVKEWLDLQDQLISKHPSTILSHVIYEAVSKARTVFYADSDAVKD